MRRKGSSRAISRLRRSCVLFGRWRAFGSGELLSLLRSGGLLLLPGFIAFVAPVGRFLSGLSGAYLCAGPQLLCVLCCCSPQQNTTFPRAHFGYPPIVVGASDPMVLDHLCCKGVRVRGCAKTATEDWQARSQQRYRGVLGDG